MGWEWKDEGNGWKTKQRRTRKPRGGQRVAARSRQSSSARSQLSSYTLPTSSERELRLLGNLSLSDLPPRAPRLHAKAFCSTTGSTVSPIAGTVVRLSTQPQVRSIRSRIDRNYWPWQPGCGQWETSKHEPFEASQSLECRKKCGCAEDESTCGDGGQGGSLVGGA